MADHPTITDEVDGAVRDWRTAAVNVITAVIAIGGLPLAVTVVMEQYLALTRPAIWITVLVYLAALVAAVARRWSSLRRMTILITAVYALAAMQLLLNGLVGDGRIVLLLLPLLALILLGTRAGWIAAGVTTFLLSLFTFLAARGALTNWRLIRDNSVDPRFWLLQSLLLLSALIPLMILLTDLLALQMKTMRAEREARRRLEEESAMRQRLEYEIMRVGEEERCRLGSELHDGLCQHLTAALLHCTAVENQLKSQQSPTAGPVNRIRAMIEESIGMAYDVAKGLCPVDMNSESLASALQALARRTRETAGIRCDCRSEGASPRQPRDLVHLYRIAQEAVANAVKHGHCRQVDIELVESPEAIVLRVRDDGIGAASPDTPKQTGGLGTRIMTYRAGVVGGTLTVEHPPEGGTRVTCRVPVIPDMETLS